MFDFVAVSGSTEGRVIEYVDHLHEHFTDPVIVERGAYRAPRSPGAGGEIKPESRAAHTYPDGAVWQAIRG
jgi:L-fuconate dehydratase